MTAETCQQLGYYAIVSRLNGLLLDVQGGCTASGTRVIPWEKNLNDNQLWYDDPINGTIRSKLNSFCMTIQDGQLRMDPLQQQNADQLWARDKCGYIRNIREQRQVIDIFGCRKDPGAVVGKYAENGGLNQLWNFQFVGGPAPPIHKKCFCIVSELNRKVLNIKDGCREPGTKVVMRCKNNPPTNEQLWYTNYNGGIFSALNDFVFEAKATGKVIRMIPPTCDLKQFWTLECRKIWNKGGTGECLEAAKEKCDRGGKVISCHYSGSSSQQWCFEYV